MLLSILAIEPSQVSLYANDEVQLELIANSGSQQLSSPDMAQVAFTSSNGAILEVSASGKIKGKGQGDARISATFKGVTATLSAKVMRRPEGAQCDTNFTVAKSKIDLVDPAKSLLITKTTSQVFHSGGEIFAAQSSEAQGFLSWASVEAQCQLAQKVVGLELDPAGGGQWLLAPVPFSSFEAAPVAVILRT